MEYLGYAWDFLINVLLANPLGTTESIARFLVLLLICGLPIFGFYIVFGGLWQPLNKKQQWNLKEGEYAIILDPEDPRYRPPDEVRVYKYK